jgi:DNA polymerase (family 10)
MESATNQTVGDLLDEISELLELKGESSFRIRAYENAARAIRNMTSDVVDMTERHALQEIPGVGDALAKKIEEFVLTGRMEYVEGLRSEFPSGVRALMKIPGVGPKMAARAYQELGTETLGALEEAARDGTLAALPRMGQKTADNLLRAIERAKQQESARTPIGDVLPFVSSVLGLLHGQEFVHNITVAGSLRRFNDTIKDVDIIGTSPEPERAFDLFMTIPGISQVVARGPTKLSVLTARGLQVDFRIVPDEAYGSLLQHFTGSKAHNVQLREYAVRRGQSLSEYGIVDVESGARQPYADEISFYAALDLPWIPPEMREGTGELEAALARSLPEVVSSEDIRGDLHLHTNWSDGRSKLEEMVASAEGLGHEYIAITDHSPSRPGGLNAERLAAQRIELDEARRRHPNIRVLHGIEVDIKTNGTLDLPNDVLADLDWVVASAHSAFNMDAKEMAHRLVSAIRSPHVDCIGHLTGRLLGRRPPYDLDLDAVFQAAADTGTVIEINASPKRLDIKDTYVRRAIEMGIVIAINTDAHDIGQLSQMEFGVRVARRGWAEACNVINTWPIEDVLQHRRG